MVVNLASGSTVFLQYRIKATDSELKKPAITVINNPATGNWLIPADGNTR